MRLRGFTWVCMRCKRDKFQQPEPHRCRGSYRKRRGWWKALSPVLKEGFIEIGHA